MFLVLHCDFFIGHSYQIYNKKINSSCNCLLRLECYSAVMGRFPRQLKPTPWHLPPFVLCLLWSVGSNHVLCGADKTSLFFLLSWQPRCPALALPGLCSQASLCRGLGARGLLQTHSPGIRCLQMPPSLWLSFLGLWKHPCSRGTLVLSFQLLWKLRAVV